MSRHTPLSPSRMIWHRFRKKKSGIIGLSFVGLCLVVSILANFIVFDHTIDADLQMPSIALRSPGFSTYYLKQPLSYTPQQQSVVDRIIRGYPKDYTILPYARVVNSGADHLTILDHYGIEKRLNLQDIINKADTDNITFWFGTDRYGRSILSRLVRGIRISLFVGCIAVFISLTLGISLGLISGYFGGWVDAIVMYLINVTWSIPTLLLVFAIVMAFGRSISIVFLAVGLTMWVDVARIVRGQVMEIKKAPFITAATSLAVSPLRIMVRHILPNIVGPILVIAAANFAAAILIEAGLSYLGFGINPPAPSIGNMLNDHYGYAISGKPFLALVPALAIMLLVLSFNLIGAGLRDAFDIKSN